MFGGVERLEPDSNNPFQEEQFSGDDCRLGRMFAQIVDKRGARTLAPILRKWVLPGSATISDCWKACDRIDEIREAGFCCCTHETVNHSKCFKDPAAGAHADTCEGAWCSQCERFVPKQACNKNALQGHLFERTWKRKHKDDLWNNLVRVLREIRHVSPSTKKGLVQMTEHQR